MKVIENFVNDRDGEIVDRWHNTIIFSLGTEYLYKVVKKGNSYVALKMVLKDNKYIKVSPEIERRTQAEIVAFLKHCRR